jgi:hypothetical protein
MRIVVTLSQDDRDISKQVSELFLEVDLVELSPVEEMLLELIEQLTCFG